MIRKDHLRNFSVVEDDHLFSERLKSEYPKKDRIKKSKPLDFIPSVKYQNVCEARELGDFESEDEIYGPFFTENDFTDEINFVPEEIRRQYKFLDLNTLLAQAKIIKEEVQIAFHPERKEKIKKESGWAGIGNADPVEIDEICTLE
jgi:hypothetical protein